MEGTARQLVSLAVEALLATLLQDLNHALRLLLLEGYLDVSALKMGREHVAGLLWAGIDRLLSRCH